MQFFNFWVIVSTIAAKLCYSVCQPLLLLNENLTYLNQESEIDQKQQISTINTEYATSQNNSQSSSTELFGDIFADCMKYFVPYSNINTNCLRDVQIFEKELHNQSIWAVKSK